MKITVKYFASIREALGLAQEMLDTQATTIAELRQQLAARSDASQQALAPSRAVRAALNQMMCDEATLLTEGCEVAFFPPVTGG